MALPPDPKQEAEKGLKTGAEAAASVLKGVFDAVFSAMTKILPGTASTPTDSKTSPASSSTSDNSSTELNIKISKIIKEAEDLAKEKEREMTESPAAVKEMTERTAAVSSSNKGAKKSPDPQKELRDKKFTHDVIEINRLPPSDKP